MSEIPNVEDIPCDLIKLTVVNRPGILFSLTHRFQQDLIYTSVGPILVAINPFKWIKGIYDNVLIDSYRQGELNLSTHPHVFAITDEAFLGLQSGYNQSLIISGESGAGKIILSASSYALIINILFSFKAKLRPLNNA